MEPFLLTACALLPFLAWDWKQTAGSLKSLAFFLLPVLFVSSLLFSWLREARNYMPLVFVLAVSAGVISAGQTKVCHARQLLFQDGVEFLGAGVFPDGGLRPD